MLLGHQQYLRIIISWGGGSLYFNGNNNYLIAPRNSINLSIPEFTIEWWEYLFDTRYGDSVFAITSNVGDENKSICAGWNESSGRYMTINNNSLFPKIGEKLLNQWVHRAIVRDANNNWYAFQNGKLFYTTNNSIIPTNTYDLPVIGRNFGDNYFYGYLSELKIYNIAKYTEEFTPQTSLTNGVICENNNNVYAIEKGTKLFKSRILDLSALSSSNQTINDIEYTIECSSCSGDGYKAFIVNSKWQTSNTNPPHYIEIQYSEPLIIASIRLKAGNDYIRHLVKDFVVTVYDENNEYIEVVSATHPNSNEIVLYNFSKIIKSTRMRITITSVWPREGYPWGGIELCEIYAYQWIIAE